MSGTVLSGAALEPTGKPAVVGVLARVASWIMLVALSPLRLYLALRHSLTGSSVTLLLIGIVSMNIVWGYPWGGIFSACGSMMLVGWTINRITRPDLAIDFSLANSAPAGQSFAVVTHVLNRSRLPAMDLGFAFGTPKRRSKSGLLFWRKRAARDMRAHEDYRAPTEPHNVALVRPAERINWSESVVFEQRGIHPLPNIVVTSMFPFHLFRSTRSYPTDVTIAVTPRLLTGEEDSVARGLLNTLGGWSHRLLSGDALDYSGSREYEVGMSVRRWDFASWARLGRPIVREFQSPSIQTVVLIVDTSPNDTDGEDIDGELLERILSLAATAVTELTRRMVRVRLYVTGESTSELAAASQAHWTTDCESLLMRLATAEAVAAPGADESVQTMVRHEGRCPILILTSREEFSFETYNAPNVTVLHVDGTQASPDSDSPELHATDSLDQRER